MSVNDLVHSVAGSRWPLARVKDHVALINGYPFSSDQFNPAVGVPLVRIRDIYSKHTEIRYAGEPVAEALIDNGDVLVGMDGEFNVAVWAGGRALLNQRVCCLRARSSINQRYLAYFLPLPLKVINDLTHSTTVKHLSSGDILSIRLPFPPVEQQSGIAAYLDRETAKIDEMLAAKERLLEILAEKRRALITHAVTRGLNPAVPMKSSGAEWLGDIPAHWQTERAKWLFRERDERSESGSEELLTVSHITGVTPRSEKDVTMFEADTMEGYKRCYPGDLVVNTLWAWMGAMGVSRHEGIVSPAYNVYVPSARLRPEYVEAICRTQMFADETRRFSKGVWSSRLRLYPEGLFSIEYPVPPLDEQIAISEHIARESRQTDDLRKALDRSVAILKERRSALIAAAVTGQLDVESAA